MKKPSPANLGRGFIMAWTLCILGIAILVDPNSAPETFCGEQSVGTWLSGFLLAVVTTLSIFLALRRGLIFWWFTASFFIMLGLDERFMFHERMKQYIVLSASVPKHVPLALAELPVIAASLFGCIMAFLIGRHVSRQTRYFLVFASLLGATSVALDVANVFLFLEDFSKIMAELVLVMGIFGEIDIA